MISFRQLKASATKLKNKKSLLILLFPFIVINLDPITDPIATPIYAMTVVNVLIYTFQPNFSANTNPICPISAKASPICMLEVIDIKMLNTNK